MRRSTSTSKVAGPHERLSESPKRGDAMTTVTKPEQTQIDNANASGKQPVMFVHGLWLLGSSWDPWAKLFESEGFAALTPGWPDDPDTVEEAKQHPEVFAKKSVGEVADHFGEIASSLKKKPAIIGHS